MPFENELTPAMELPIEVAPKPMKKWVGMLFITYCLFYAFVFRDLLLELPAIFRGDSAVSADELVPFFNWQTQFFDQVLGEFSPLTNQYEFRIRYSILTTWMRFYAILPVTLVLVAAGTATIVSAGVLRLSRLIVEDSRSLRIVIAASSLVLTSMLLYSKITHFYTLVFGWSLFTAATCLLIEAIFLSRKGWWKIFLGASALIVMNPTVHFVLLYLIVTAVLLLFLCFVKQEKKLSKLLGIPLLTLALIIFPYAVFVKFFVSTNIEISDTVPVNFYLIQSTSVPLFNQLTFDLSGIMNQFLIGSYQLPTPHFVNLFYTLCIFFALYKIRSLKEQGQKSSILAVGILFAVSIWFAFGYALPTYFPSFHRLLAWTIHLFGYSDAPAARLFSQIAGTVVHVLRFPHRFQLMTFTAASILIPIGAVLWAEALRKVTAKQESRLGLLFLLAIILLPWMSQREMRLTYMTGDFGGLLAPYPMKHLREVREKLQTLPVGKTMVLPSSETAKLTIDSLGRPHRFMSKFFIYALNLPSVYYGLDSAWENKALFFAFYQFLQSRNPQWVDVLRSGDIRYVIWSKEMASNPKGTEYLRGIETSGLYQLEHSIGTRKIFENDGFTVFEILQPTLMSAVTDGRSLEQLCVDPTRESHWIFTPSKLISNEQHLSPTITREQDLDLKILRGDLPFVIPDSTTFPFDKTIIPSSLYTDNLFRAFGLQRPSKYNYMNVLTQAVFDTLTGQFVGIPERGTLLFQTAVQSGRYEVLVRGITTKNSLEITMGNQSIVKQLDGTEAGAQYFYLQDAYRSRVSPLDIASIQSDILNANKEDIAVRGSKFAYVSLGNIQLAEDHETIILRKLDNFPLLIEGLVLIPINN